MEEQTTTENQFNPPIIPPNPPLTQPSEQPLTIKRPLASKTYLILFIIGVIGFLAIVGGGGVYLLRNNPTGNEQTSTPQSTKPTNESTTTAAKTATKSADSCVAEKDNILSIVTAFELFQKIKNATGVLALFTSPKQQSDVEDYKNLSGEDNSIEPRLYNNVATNYNTESYKVTQQPTKSANNSCVVKIEEQRSNYGGPTNPTYLPAETMGFILTLVKEDGNWKVDQYNSQDSKIKAGKYNGFLMELN